MTVSSNASLLRFVVVALALAVTIVIGYLKFTRRRVAPPAESGNAVPSDVAERLAAVEHKLDALGRALQG